MTNQSHACPCCGRAFPKAKAASQPVTPLEQMTDAELRAHYKATAPVEDVRFQLRLRSVSGDVREGYARLLDTLLAQGGKATPHTRREYARLQQQWRESATPAVYVAAGRSGWLRKVA